MTRMQPLASLLLCATAGRYKARAGIGCQLAVPYGANPHGVAQYEAAPEAARPLLVSFSGSLDVCCSGQKIRCAVGDVMVAAHDQADDAILASVREDDPERSIGNDTCAARTLTKLEAATNATCVAGVRRTWANAFAMPFHVTAAQVAMSQRAGGAMARSVFCLIPAGDTYISSRLYSAIGAGCLPVILGDPILRVAAFASRVNYSSFAVQVVERDFLRHPTELVPWLRRMPAAEDSEAEATSAGGGAAADTIRGAKWQGGGRPFHRAGRGALLPAHAPVRRKGVLHMEASSGTSHQATQCV